MKNITIINIDLCAPSVCLTSESEFNEFKAFLKSRKNRFQLSPGLNLEKLNTILSDTNHF